MKRIARFCSTFLTALALDSTAVENWPQLRGPRRQRHLVGARRHRLEPRHAPQNVPSWIRDLPGLGHASPIVWNDRHLRRHRGAPGRQTRGLKTGIYGDGQSYDEKEPHQWRLLCFDKTMGNLLWDKLGYEAVPRQQRHTKASHCNSTPATDGQRVAAIFGSEGLFCFDMEGLLLWHKDLGKMDAGPWDVPTLQWSFAQFTFAALGQGHRAMRCLERTVSRRV